LLPSSDFSDGFIEPDFKDSIAATAASSSDTCESSFFSSERTPTIAACSPGGGVRLGVTTIGDF
jgi:hypothetical protein